MEDCVPGDMLEAMYARFSRLYFGDVGYTFVLRNEKPVLKIVDRLMAIHEFPCNTYEPMRDQLKKFKDPVDLSGDKFKVCIDLAKRGEISKICNLYPELYLKYKVTLDSLVEFNLNELSKPCGVWVKGNSGSGKDLAVYHLGDVFNKPLNKWWDGYKGEKYILLSDVKPHHCKWITDYLKIWADRYAFIAETKERCFKIRPQKIFVTSTCMMKDCVPSDSLPAMCARFNNFELIGSGMRGYRVTERREKPTSQRMLRVLQLHEFNMQDKRRNIKKDDFIQKYKIPIVSTAEFYADSD